ncbi:zinc finger protein 813-like [Bradysia coprophila]|uniref:zinc finger protein 813-like n=1 Tax=Bradysia coprophila TaxID=38358 RepID=UPI00187DB107|nr:zinc finger protein 813-like [Bradysia coprophila]
MASILDISETFLENPEHAALPNIEFDTAEENMFEDILDVLDSLAPPVSPSSIAAHHVGQNFSVLGCTNWDTVDISCDIDRYIMEAEQAAPVELTSQVGQNSDVLGYINYASGSSSRNISCNVYGAMQLDQAAPRELASQFVPNLSDLGYINYESCSSNSNIDRNVGGSVMRTAPGEVTDFSDLGCINFDSDASSCNVSWTRMTKLNSSCNAMLNYCEPDVDVAIENHQMEEVLSNVEITVDSIEQSENASQPKKCQVQLSGKSTEIPLKNAAKGHRKQSTSFHCAECGKQFSRKATLIIHSRVHTGKKPYKCTQCDYASAQAINLCRHERIHSENEFKCDICNRTFRHKAYLIDHKNVHTGEKPYECDVCNETFALRARLYNHRYQRHRKEASRSRRYATFDGSKRC